MFLCGCSGAQWSRLKFQCYCSIDLICLDYCFYFCFQRCTDNDEQAGHRPELLHVCKRQSLDKITFSLWTTLHAPRSWIGLANEQKFAWRVVPKLALQLLLAILKLLCSLLGERAWEVKVRCTSAFVSMC